MRESGRRRLMRCISRPLFACMGSDLPVIYRNHWPVEYTCIGNSQGVCPKGVGRAYARIDSASPNPPTARGNPATL